MSVKCISLSLPAYLSQWLKAECGSGQQIRFPRGSVESHILELCLRAPKEGDAEPIRQEGDLQIAIPTIQHRDPEVHNYLPPKARAALVTVIHRRFDMQLFSDISRFHASARELQDIVAAWMESHDIEDSETNTLAVMKRYQRLRARYLHARRQRNFRKRKKAEKS